jgi:putative peptide zinc metalloprotease protein
VTTPRKYKLREDLVVRRRVFGGEVKYVVKDPIRLEYFTIDEFCYSLLSFCDGERDFGELVEIAERLFPGSGLDAPALLNFYETYRKFKFFEDTWERNILLIERQRTNRSRALKKAFANPLEITLPAWDPDRFFNRIVNPLGFMFTWKALVVYTAIILLAIWITLTNASEFALSFGELFVIKGQAFLGIVVLWIVLFLTVVLHEVGHGLTTKKFGGEVHRMGFLFLYFNPCLYCDVTEAYFFEDKRQKHAVTLAGGIVDLLTAAIATFVWYLTSPELFINEVAHRVAIFNGVSGIIVNFNPLMKYDGYYLLSDHLEIPNLRGDSFRFVGNRIRSALGLPFEEELHTSRERRIFSIYGVLAILYSIFVLFFVVMFVGSWLVAEFRGVGYLITAGLVLLMTKKYIIGLGGFVRFFALDKAGHFKRHRWKYAGAAAAVLILFFLAPVPRHVRGGFSLAPGREVVLRARESGVVSGVHAEEGELVLAGESPVSLLAEKIELEHGHAVAVAAAAGAGRAAAQVARDRSEAALQHSIQGAGAAMERYHASREMQMTPVAPWDGVVLTPYMNEKLGIAVTPGDTLCVLGDLSSLRAEVLLDEADMGMVDTDKPVELRTASNSGRLIVGHVERVALVPSGGTVRQFYRVLVRVDNAGGELRPDLTGTARFRADNASPFMHLVGRVARIFRIEFWI